MTTNHGLYTLHTIDLDLQTIIIIQRWTSVFGQPVELVTLPIYDIIRLVTHSVNIMQINYCYCLKYKDTRRVHKKRQGKLSEKLISRTYRIALVDVKLYQMK